MNVGGHCPSRADPVAPYEATTIFIVTKLAVKRSADAAIIGPPFAAQSCLLVLSKPSINFSYSTSTTSSR